MNEYYLVTLQDYPIFEHPNRLEEKHFFEKYPTTDQLISLLVSSKSNPSFDVYSDFSLSFSPPFGTFPIIEYSVYTSGDYKRFRERRKMTISEVTLKILGINYKFFPDYYNLEKFLTHSNPSLRELVKGYIKNRGK